MNADASRAAIDNRRDVIELRTDLAAAFRLAVRHGFHEGVCNHFSVMLDRDRFLINPRGVHWSRISASRVLMVDAVGNVIEGDGEPIRSGVCIHTRIHLGHPKARVVLHTHMPYATTLSAIAGGRIEPVHQNALRFVDRCAYDDEFNGLADSPEEGDRMARAMGDKPIMFLGNHGVVVVADTIAKAYDDLYYLERACQIQVMAMSTGRPLKRIPDAIAARGAVQFQSLGDGPEVHFAGLKEVLDREEPDYAS